MKKTLFSLIALTFCLFLQGADASVGYINQTFGPGYNFFCNQLNATPDNTANNTIFNAPLGTALTQWDPITAQYLPYSFFDGSSWSINYNLALGQGAVLYTTAFFTNTFVGETSAAAPPPRTDGLYLAGNILPISGAGFSDVIGRPPVAGESVSEYDRITASFNTKFFDGVDWVDSGSNPVAAPSLDVMEAAFFGLGEESGATQPPLPPPVPEPSVPALLLVCGTLLKVMSGCRKRLI